MYSSTSILKLYALDWDLFMYIRMKVVLVLGICLKKIINLRKTKT